MQQFFTPMGHIPSGNSMNFESQEGSDSIHQTEKKK